MSEDRKALFGDRNFRWHISGSFANMIGDQFTMLALPWLVLQTTGDPLKVGVVLGVLAIPRFVFLLFGGAVVDHYSAKTVLLVGRICNAILLGAFGLAIFMGVAHLWLIYGFAIISGALSAFYIPAARSILRSIVPMERLGAATSFIESLRQGTMCVAPLVAGIIIATLGDGARGGGVGSLAGLGVAFALDGLTFAISAFTLAKVKTTLTATSAAPPRMLNLVREGLAYSWQDGRLRVILIYAVITGVCASGPIAVAIPLLARAIGNDAGSLGLLTGAVGLGSLFGVIIAGWKPQWSAGRLGATMLIADGSIGLVFIAIGQSNNLWAVAALMTIVGTLVGYQQLVVSVWLQHYVQGSMIGRVLSLLMIISIGVAPLSGIVVGWIARNITAQELFAGVGGVLLLVTIAAWWISPMRTRLATEQGSTGA